jgi:hypothetical protein
MGNIQSIISLGDGRFNCGPILLWLDAAVALLSCGSILCNRPSMKARHRAALVEADPIQ